MSVLGFYFDVVRALEEIGAPSECWAVATANTAW